MIKVYTSWQDLDEANQFMFKKLFSEDTLLHAKAFVISPTWDQIDRLELWLSSNMEIKYNSDDFTMQDAPEWYGVVLW